MEIFEWIEKALGPKQVNSVTFMYNSMESQSGFCLPIIYQPFDATKRSHWRDRGSVLDFLFATRCGSKRVLDFGPGDGWPSLVISPYVREVVGVDGSEKRVSVCKMNAGRMGVANARFIHVAPGHALPFDEGSFDAVVAASSIEQTPDPRRAIKECCRVLRPGGRLRIFYEALSDYRNGKERELFFDSNEKGNCVLTLYDRRIDDEIANMYKIRFTVPCRNVFSVLLEGGKRVEEIDFHSLSISKLEHLKAAIAGLEKCTLTHPSCETLVGWMQDSGFREVYPSQSGAKAASEIFDGIPARERPKTWEGVDAMLKAEVKVAVEQDAPLAEDPLITAVK
jgi:ubiquinone/menaquinone biosynthesis C-methylase UbiE